MPRPTYTEGPVPPALAGLALCTWAFTVPDDHPGVLAHDVPPDGCVSLVWTGFGVTVVGPRMGALRVPLPPGARPTGLRLWPDAAPAVLGLSGAALRDRMVPFATALPGHPPPESPDDVVPVAPDALDPAVRALVRGIASASGDGLLGPQVAEGGPSRRQLQRRFRAAVGLTMQEYARLRRFRSALDGFLVAGPGRWGRIAHEAGYADQAHLSREFAALTGRAPVAFGRWTDTLDHDRVQAAR